MITATITGRTTSNSRTSSRLRSGWYTYPSPSSISSTKVGSAFLRTTTLTRFFSASIILKFCCRRTGIWSKCARTSKTLQRNNISASIITKWISINKKTKIGLWILNNMSMRLISCMIKNLNYWIKEITSFNSTKILRIIRRTICLKFGNLVFLKITHKILFMDQEEIDNLVFHKLNDCLIYFINYSFIYQT